MNAFLKLTFVLILPSIIFFSTQITFDVGSNYVSHTYSLSPVTHTAFAFMPPGHTTSCSFVASSQAYIHIRIAHDRVHLQIAINDV